MLDNNNKKKILFKRELSFEGKKLIIFDLDGTILNLKVDWTMLKNILSERFSKIYGTAPIKFKRISTCLDLIVEKNDEAELENFLNMIRDFELKNIQNNEYIEETIYFIKEKEKFGVKRSTKLAIFSLNTRECIIESLKLASVQKKFDIIIGREDVRKWKPDPEGLLKIKEHFNLDNEEMIYIGDSEVDLMTGQNAGVETHLIKELISIINLKYKK